MKFPILCVDDFYKDPKEIREYALSLEYPQNHSSYPGIRTLCLHEVNKEFFDLFCEKLFSAFYNFKNDWCRWEVSSFFQKTYQKDSNPKSILNTGWDHKDDDVVLAGVIYLNENSYPDSGTTISKLKEIYNKKNFEVRDKFYSGEEIDIDSYKLQFKEHKKYFEDSIIVKNQFNRLICYDSSYFHRETNFYSNEEFRLTQVFFVKKFESVETPIDRIQKSDL